MNTEPRRALTASDILGVIGDVHAEDELLVEALAGLGRVGATTVLCTGDLADGPGSVERCCRLLQEHRVVTVRGNHDRWLLSDTMRNLPGASRREELHADVAAYLARLPETVRFTSPIGGVLLCHGLGDDDMASVSGDDFGYALENNLELQALIADPAVRVVINGHTHRPLVRHFHEFTVVNAGTLLREHDAGYVVIDFGSGDVSWHGLGDPAGREIALGSLVR